jgi:hypothetical protein
VGHRVSTPFVIVGSARSGTTLVRMFLNSHSDVAVPPESRFIVELWRGESIVDVSETLEALAAHPRYQLWELPIEAVRAGLRASTRAPYADVIAAAYRAYAQSRDKGRWGDKTPRYVQHIPFLASLFPNSRFVHIIRDGRNVALSYADVPFGPKTVARAAALWADRVGAGVREGRALGEDRYLELRYEDLVSDVEDRVRSLCDFLDLTFEREMLEYTERGASDALPRARLYNPHVAEKPIPSVRSWEEQMPDAHVEIFEAVAGDLLTGLGYPRQYPAPGTGARLAAFLARKGLPLGRLRSNKHRRGNSQSEGDLAQGRTDGTS